jgi:thiamine-monophosphate kinase
MYDQNRFKGLFDKEREAILIFMDNLGQKEPDHYFETDSSVFKVGEEEWLFTTDEFSTEDNFRSSDGPVLGWNLAAATISDILAAGGIPAFYGHSVTIQNDWDNRFIEGLSKGISRCLHEAGAAFLGGDLGMSDHWRYTGTAIGRKLTSLSRKGAKEGDVIFMTGHAGAGNLEAALKLYSEYKTLKPLLGMVSVKFPLRIKEAALVRKYANCCIDSSDGLFRALKDLARISRTGFEVASIPYLSQGQLACMLLGKPVEILFLGECGEYELVFTVSGQREKEFLTEARAGGLEFSKLGHITEEKQLIRNNHKTIDLSGYSIFARNYENVEDYIREVVHFIEDGSA